jgi:Ca-activated chloride channel family protein
MRALLFPALVVLAATQALGQQPTFRTGTRVVPVPTMVTDGDGRLVPDLEQSDFTVLDNGKSQEIVVFENTVQPFTAVVMLDFSLSMTAHLKLLQAATEQFVLRLLPIDKAQVGAFSDKIQFSGEFTTDRDALIRALSDLQYGNPTRLYDAIDLSVQELHGIEGRKVVVVFTDGEDTESRLGFTEVRNKARDRDVMVYAIGLHSKMLGQVTRPDGNLRRLADATGGGYFELKSTDDLGPTFTRVAQELHALYTLAFVPETMDGKEHTIQVKVNKPGMKTRARTTYIASNQPETSSQKPTGTSGK